MMKAFFLNKVAVITGILSIPKTSKMLLLIDATDPLVFDQMNGNREAGGLVCLTSLLSLALPMRKI